MHPRGWGRSPNFCLIRLDTKEERERPKAGCVAEPRTSAWPTKFGLANEVRLGQRSSGCVCVCGLMVLLDGICAGGRGGALGAEPEPAGDGRAPGRRAGRGAQGGGAHPFGGSKEGGEGWLSVGVCWGEEEEGVRETILLCNRNTVRDDHRSVYTSTGNIFFLRHHCAQLPSVFDNSCLDILTPPPPPCRPPRLPAIVATFAVFSWALKPYRPLPPGWFQYNREGCASSPPAVSFYSGIILIAFPANFRKIYSPALFMWNEQHLHICVQYPPFLPYFQIPRSRPPFSLMSPKYSPRKTPHFLSFPAQCQPRIFPAYVHIVSSPRNFLTSPPIKPKFIPPRTGRRHKPKGF